MRPSLLSSLEGIERGFVEVYKLGISSDECCQLDGELLSLQPPLVGILVLAVELVAHGSPPHIVPPVEL